jgi:hypothetical protein
MRSLLFALILVAPALSQTQPTPPLLPTPPATALIGVSTAEPGAATSTGDQRLFAYCAAASARTNGVGFGVAINSTVYWSSTAEDPSGVAYGPGNLAAMSLFILGPHTAVSSPVAGAAAGFDLGLIDVGLSAVFSPFYYHAEDSVDVWSVELAIPNDPALVGTKWASQAFRLDPTNGLLYLSNLVAVEIMP